MSSQVEQEQFIEGLREDGILDEMKASLGRAEAPAEEAETVEEPEQTPEEVDTPEGQPEPEVPAEPEPEPEPEAPEADTPAVSVDDELTIEITPEVQEYLDKYGGDLNEALRAAASAQTLIGRQGNELGDVRRELEGLRQRLDSEQYQYEAPPQPYQTYLPDPEEADEQEMAAAYSSLAHEALERADGDTMQRAVEAWKDLDPFGASVFVGQLQAQVYEKRIQDLQVSRHPDELAQGMEELKTKYPDLPHRVEEIGQEAERWPTLGYVLHGGSPSERVQALEALYLQVANRHSSETSQQALRRVAVKQSEEARKARQQAQVAASGRGSVSEPEATPHLIPLGRTGRSVDLNRVDEILQSDRI